LLCLLLILDQRVIFPHLFPSFLHSLPTLRASTLDSHSFGITDASSINQRLRIPGIPCINKIETTKINSKS
jgi:hypothetical protein